MKVIMIKIYDRLQKIYLYFVPKNNDHILKSNKKNSITLAINDIENKFTLLKQKKKDIELYANMANFNYHFLNDYIKILSDTEIINKCKTEVESLIETGKFLKRLSVLLETLEFRLTEKLNIIKNYDLDNKNNDEINEKLKNLTKKIKTEFELLEDMESSLDYQEEFLLWEQCMKLMKEKK